MDLKRLRRLYDRKRKREPYRGLDSLFAEVGEGALTAILAWGRETASPRQDDEKRLVEKEKARLIRIADKEEERGREEHRARPKN